MSPEIKENIKAAIAMLNLALEDLDRSDELALNAIKRAIIFAEDAETNIYRKKMLTKLKNKD